MMGRKKFLIPEGLVDVVKSINECLVSQVNDIEKRIETARSGVLEYADFESAKSWTDEVAELEKRKEELVKALNEFPLSFMGSTPDHCRMVLESFSILREMAPGRVEVELMINTDYDDDDDDDDEW